MITDCLIIGGGITARRAAQIVSQKYETVLISDGAGASPYVHGICIPLDKEDSLACFIEDTLASGKGLGDRSLVRTLCEGALSLADEYEFDRREDGEYDLLRPLGASHPRVASIHAHTGVYVMDAINQSKGFCELTHVRALRLTADNGRITGAYCFDKKTGRWLHIAARCVILASGGYCGVYPFSTNSSDIGGDGIAMAYLAGASLRDLEFIQFEPTAALSPDALIGKSVITTMLFEGATFRNADGETFFSSDRVDKDILSKGIYREVLRGKGTKRGGVYYDATGVSPSLLKGKYKSYYQRYLDVGVDITKEYMEVAPAPHTSLGGIVIDTECRTAIKGLFAAGEVAGGLHGANRLGGNAGLETMVYGKIAGQSACNYLMHSEEVSEISLDTPDTQEDVTALHQELRSLAGSALNVIREEHAMKKALLRVMEIERELSSDRLSYHRLRAENDAIAIRLTLEAAIQREGSIGAHERSDATDENSNYNIFISKSTGLRKEKINE